MTDYKIMEDTKPIEFLEEEQPGVVYIKPKLDLSLSDKQKSDCWDILMEIRKFGINQRQLLFLVDLLAMEVESNVTMKAIRAATEAGRGKPPGAEETKPSGLILP